MPAAFTSRSTCVDSSDLSSPTAHRSHAVTGHRATLSLIVLLAAAGAVVLAFALRVRSPGSDSSSATALVLDVPSTLEESEPPDRPLMLQLDGLSATVLFLRGTLDKVGVSPNFVHVGRYKSAIETYARRDMSPPAREALEALLDDHYRLLVDSLASARDRSPAFIQRQL